MGTIENKSTVKKNKKDVLTKGLTNDPHLNPWRIFTEETGGKIMEERKGWFIFREKIHWLDVPIGNHTMSLSYGYSNSTKSPWMESHFISGENSDINYIITCMTIPYRTSKALTFKVHKKRGISMVPKLFRSKFVKTGDPVFDNTMIIKTSDVLLAEQLFSNTELRTMVSKYLGRQYASPWILKNIFYFHRASNHGWAWLESIKDKKNKDGKVNKLRLIYSGRLEDGKLLRQFYQMLIRMMEALITIGCVEMSDE